MLGSSDKSSSLLAIKLYVLHSCTSTKKETPERFEFEWSGKIAWSQGHLHSRYERWWLRN